MNSLKSILTAFLIALFLSSCGSSVQLHDQITETQAVDLTSYSDEGFMFTAGDYGEEFETIGILTVTVWPEVREYEEGAEDRGWVKLFESNPDRDAMYKPVELRAAFDAAYEKAMSMGANAIIQMDFSRPMESGRIPGVKISGMAIARE